MSTLIKIAWRNVWRQRRRTFLIAGAMGFIMALLVVYDGVLGGFNDAIYANSIQIMGGNIQVHAPGYSDKIGKKPLLPLANPDAVITAADSNQNVVLATKRIVTGGLVTNREGAFSVGIIGLDPEKEASISQVAKNISEGRFLQPDDGDLIVIGQGLATIMNIKVGDRITMVGNATHEQTRQRTMTVVGIYDVGVPSVEKGTIYMSLSEAQQLFDLNGQVTEIVVNLHQIGEEPSVVDTINTSQPGYDIATWETSIPELKQTLELKSRVMGIFGIGMLCIAAIGILNLLMMAVFERTREIGVLGAMGLKPGQITTLFLLEGILIGVAGAALGTVLGLLLNGALAYYGMDFSAFADATEYSALISGRIYSQMSLLKVFQHAITILIISALAALSPAREAARREPAEALHYV